MNIVLWVLQILLGVYFLLTGLVHFIVPPGLPEPMSWMYELPAVLHYISGIAEILGGLGLILTGLTRTQTRLTALAGAGLALVMLGAAVWHLQRGEFQNIFMNLFLAVLLAVITYGRLRLHPLPERKPAL